MIDLIQNATEQDEDTRASYGQFPAENDEGYFAEDDDLIDTNVDEKDPYETKGVFENALNAPLDYETNEQANKEGWAAPAVAGAVAEPIQFSGRWAKH